MTTNAVERQGLPDLGLVRVLDLSPSAVRRQKVRRRSFVALALVVGLGTIAGVFLAYPEESTRPVLPLPFASMLVGIGVAGLSIVVSLAGLVTAARAGLDGLSNRDPLRDLSWSDRSWVRARIAAGAPVAPAQMGFVWASATWASKQPAAVPQHVGLGLLGLGIVLGSPGVMSLLVGLLLIAEGAILAALALRRARASRAWLSLYAPTPAT